MTTANSRRRPAPRQTDDAGALHEDEQLVEGTLVEEDPLEEKRNHSNRPARARVQPGGRPPQDRRESKAAAEARQREGLDDDMKITTEYGGVVFTFDPAAFSIRYQLTAERGRPALALLEVIGEDAMEEILDWPVSELQELTQHLAKEAGLGN